MKNKLESSDKSLEYRDFTITVPSVESGLAHLAEFYLSLSMETRNYLKYDVTDTYFCRTRVGQVDGVNHWRLVAETDGKVVGDATMDRDPFSWTSHVAEIRVIVFPDYLHMGIGPALLRNLAELGVKNGVEYLYTEVMVEQTEFISALELSGFEKESIRKGYARDLNGNEHDVLVMSNNLEQIWSQLLELTEQTEKMEDRED